MNTKLFTIAGTASYNGKVSLRCATGNIAVRVAKLKQHGFADINLIELPKPMTKVDAGAYLAAQGIEFANKIKAAVQEMVQDAVETPVEAEVTETVEEVVAEAIAEAVDEVVALTAEEKLARKRARDAARKREKRAAEKAAREAAMA